MPRIRLELERCTPDERAIRARIVCMARDDNLMKHAPDRVALFQELFSAPSRLLVLRALMPKPLTFNELFNTIGNTMSRPAVHSALVDLRSMGYIEDDAPDDVLRRPAGTKFTARRDLITRDFGQVLEFILG